MKGMPLPFDSEGKGVLDLELVVRNKKNSPEISSNYFYQKYCLLDNYSFVEPTSVLDSARFPSRPTSSSTLSSSHGGGGGGAASTDTAGVAPVSDTNPSPKWTHDSTTATSSNADGGADSELHPVPLSLEIRPAATVPEKSAMEDWESVLSESVAVSPGQEQSFLRWIMGDIEDPSMGNLNKALQIGGGGYGGSAPSELEFGGVFAANVDRGFGDGEYFMSTLQNFPVNRSENNIGLASTVSSNPTSNFKISHNILHNSSSLFNNHGAVAFDSSPEIKPHIFNSQLLINQHQTQQIQNTSFFFPLSYPQQQEHNTFGPPPAKRHNPEGAVDEGFEPVGLISRGPFIETGQSEALFVGRQNLQHLQHQLLPHYLQRPIGPMGPRPKINELGHSHHQLQQAIVDQIYKAAELVETGNPALAQGILARLNHHLSPIGKPFQRAAFYCKEALHLLLNTNNNNNNNNNNNLNPSPFSLVFKISAYKSFSEISPLIQFANFTCNQAILEVLEDSSRIHIVDFDIGLGGQWASLIQELAFRNGGTSGPPSLKITVLASLYAHDQLELGLTRENLILFANEINISFEFEIMSVDHLNSASWFHTSEDEAVVVNLPIGYLANNYQISPASIFRFVKQLSPRIMVSVDRGCDRTDLPFPNHIIHVLQSYSNLLESLDAVNVNMDALQKIERFLLQPGIEKIVMSRFRAPEKTQHWRTLFLSSGFSPVTFSNFTESQAECVIKRTPVRGFQVEKRQSSLVLCWQRKELISASAWRC